MQVPSRPAFLLSDNRDTYLVGLRLAFHVTIKNKVVRSSDFIK